MKTPLESVSIAGNAQVGEILTATVAPAQAQASYQWKQSGSGRAKSSYSNIVGATEKTYELKADQQGKTIICEAVGSGVYTGTVTSQPTSPVQPAAAGGP